jgi:thymidylate synthase (FAD)
MSSIESVVKTVPSDTYEKSCPLGDGISSVEILETMGDDLTVVNAARVSFSKESLEMTTGDEKLINYLAKHNHISPFFHPQIRFRIKMPIFVAREWYRHTIGFSRNEVSRRYIDSKPEVFIPTELRERDERLKQGSKDTSVSDDLVYQKLKEVSELSLQCYEYLLSESVAPEMARIILPQSMYTEFIETASLYAYARLCKLRLDPHAQKEIRDYANAISHLLEKRFPISWKALMN